MEDERVGNFVIGLGEQRPQALKPTGNSWAAFQHKSLMSQARRVELEAAGSFTSVSSRHIFMPITNKTKKRGHHSPPQSGSCSVRHQAEAQRCTGEAPPRARGMCAGTCACPEDVRWYLRVPRRMCWHLRVPGKMCAGV